MLVRPNPSEVRAMDDLFSLPGRAYDYVYSTHGYIGLLVAGLAVVVGIVFVFIFFDRRK